MIDLISRQAAIDALQKEINKGKPPFDNTMGAIRCGVRLARNIIEDLPSAQQERKKGKWVYKNDLKQFFCSECGYPSFTYDDVYIYGMDLPNYCEDCGTDMRGEQDE